MRIDKDSIQYVKNNILNCRGAFTEKILKALEKHADRYNSYEICAYYSDWEDFCSDWCDGCGYTRTAARKLLHGGIGEFQILPDSFGIVRFTV